MVVAVWLLLGVVVCSQAGLAEATLPYPLSLYDFKKLSLSCKKIAYVRTVVISGCEIFTIKTNACRGVCESLAVPSRPETLEVNPSHRITSLSKCCNIIDTHDVEVDVMCEGEMKTLTFKSAKSCQCSLCQKE